MELQSASKPTTQSAFLAGGCFWCLEAAFSKLKGVHSVISGYSGGDQAHPTYDEVCSGKTGHTETVQVDYDPSRISFSDLLHIFFSLHDPTTLNRQGNDVGTQYRSAIFYANAEEERTAREVIDELTQAKTFANPIVTEVVPITTFYPAESYHQHYYEQHPEQGYCQLVIAPKLAKLRAKYQDRYQPN